MSSENQEVSILPQSNVGNLQARRKSWDNLQNILGELPATMQGYAQGRTELLSAIGESGHTTFLQQLQEEIRSHDQKLWKILNTPEELRREINSEQRMLFEWNAAAYYVSACLQISYENGEGSSLSINEAYKLMRILDDKDVASFKKDGQNFVMAPQNPEGDAILKKLCLRKLITSEVLPCFREARNSYQVSVRELKEKATVEGTISELMATPEEGRTFELFVHEKTNWTKGGGKKDGRRTLSGTILVELHETQISRGRGDSLRVLYDGWVLRPVEVVDRPPSLASFADTKRPRVPENTLSDVISTEVEIPLSTLEHYAANKGEGINLPYRVEPQEKFFEMLNAVKAVSGALQDAYKRERFKAEFAEERESFYDELSGFEEKGITVFVEEDGQNDFFSETQPAGATYLCHAEAGERPWEEKLHDEERALIRRINRFGAHVTVKRECDKGPIEVVSFPPRLKDFFENGASFKQFISFFVEKYNPRKTRSGGATQVPSKEDVPSSKVTSSESNGSGKEAQKTNVWASPQAKTLAEKAGVADEKIGGDGDIVSIADVRAYCKENGKPVS